MSLASLSVFMLTSQSFTLSSCVANVQTKCYLVYRIKEAGWKKFVMQSSNLPKDIHACILAIHVLSDLSDIVVT